MKTSHSMDKSAWPDGPWKTEPDFAQWIDEKTGFDCVIIRNQSGALCGYVGLPKSNRFYGQQFSVVRGTPAHGGLTFDGPCKRKKCYHVICKVQGVAHKSVWWFGFDCMHSRDMQPAMASLIGHAEMFALLFEGTIYREFFYVEDSVRRLADFLAEEGNFIEGEIA